MRENRLRAVEYCCPDRVQRVECAGASKAFELPSVEQTRIDPRGEVLDAGERARPLPFFNQGFHRFLTYALERSQSITDGAVLHGEMRVAGVDVGRKALDRAAAHVFDERGQPVSLRHV